MLTEFAKEATAALAVRFWRPFFFADAVDKLRARFWLSDFRGDVESVLYLRERAAAEIRKRDQQRQQLAMEMAEMFAGHLDALRKKYGEKLVINALLDVACGMTSVSFPPHVLDAVFHEMAIRVRDTDWRRAQARQQALSQKRLAVVGGMRRTPGGIILPK